jgi:hypothetical protein
MRERAHLAGGWVTAGPDGEQFRVTAFVPYGLRTAETAESGGVAGAADGDAGAEHPQEAHPQEAQAEAALRG